MGFSIQVNMKKILFFSKIFFCRKRKPCWSHKYKRIKFRLNSHPYIVSELLYKNSKNLIKIADLTFHREKSLSDSFYFTFILIYTILTQVNNQRGLIFTF